MYEAPNTKERIKVKQDDADWHYVVVEKDERSDDGMLIYDKYDDMGYIEEGQISRRKVLMKIPQKDYQAQLRADQDKSRKLSKLPPVPTGEDGKPLPGMQDNYMKEMEPVNVHTFLGQRDPDAD